MENDICVRNLFMSVSKRYAIEKQKKKLDERTKNNNKKENETKTS